MSLNIRKAKSINNFISKLTKTKKEIMDNPKNSKVTHNISTKREGLLEYFQNFLTPKRPTLIKQNILLLKNKNNNKNYISTIQEKNELKNPSNYSSFNKSKKNSIPNSKRKIIFRNDNGYNEMGSLKYKDRLKKYFFKTNNCEEYSKKIRGFSPKNRYRLMKIYQSLMNMNYPCIKKEAYNEIRGEGEYFNNDENVEEKNDNELKLKNKNEVKNYIIENVNSLQFSKMNKDNINNNNFDYYKKNEAEENSELNKLTKFYSDNNIVYQNKKEKFNNNSKINLKKMIVPNKNYLQLNNNVQKSNRDVIRNVINDENIKNGKNNKLDNSHKYDKANIMEKCLNKLFFDYSDGNYLNSNNYKYLSDDNQDNNIIINKEIIKKKEEKKQENNEHNNLVNEQIINNQDLNQISNKNRIIETEVNPDNKENINTENLKLSRDLILSLDNGILDNNKNIIKKELNKPKLMNLIYDQNKKDIKSMNELNEGNKINLNLNYLYENKNFVNIQLLSESRNNNNQKKVPSLKNDVYRHSKLIKQPKTNLELLLDKIPRHDNEVNFNKAHSMKHSNNDIKNLRKSKIIEFINKNSAIMPPNNYNTTNQIVYSF